MSAKLDVRLDAVIEQMNLMASALRTTGQKYLSYQISDWSDKLLLLKAEAIEEYNAESLEAFRRAEQSSGNVLQSALAGIKLGQAEEEQEILVCKYEVCGKGLFPVDMLRYDACWPSSSDDALALLLCPVPCQPELPRTISLIAIQPPTKERWESFGWRLLGEATPRLVPYM
jgi:hypothetical protein